MACAPGSVNEAKRAEHQVTPRRKILIAQRVRAPRKVPTMSTTSIRSHVPEYSIVSLGWNEGMRADIHTLAAIELMTPMKTIHGGLARSCSPGLPQ